MILTDRNPNLGLNNVNPGNQFSDSVLNLKPLAHQKCEINFKEQVNY